MVAVQYHDLDKVVVMAEHRQVDMRMVVMYATQGFKGRGGD
jgi:hypothetical protein